MQLNLVVAFCKNRGIGIDNTLPWNIPNDLKRFSKLTKGLLHNPKNHSVHTFKNALIMGRNTWDSLPRKPLPKRDHLILSNTLNIDKICDSKNKELIKTFNNIENVLEFCKTNSYDNIWVIGGSSIYQQFLQKYVFDNIYITYIDKEFECDTFFSELNGHYIEYNKSGVKSYKIWCKESDLYYKYIHYKKAKISSTLFFKHQDKEWCVTLESINKDEDNEYTYDIRFMNTMVKTTADKLSYM